MTRRFQQLISSVAADENPDKKLGYDEVIAQKAAAILFDEIASPPIAYSFLAKHLNKSTQDIKKMIFPQRVIEDRYGLEREKKFENYKARGKKVKSVEIKNVGRVKSIASMFK